MNRFCDVYINICDKAKYDWQFWCLYRHFWCPAVSEIVFCNFLDEDCMTGKIATLEVSLEGKALTTPVLLEHSGWKSPKKLHFRKITKLTIFGIFNQLLSTQNVARFARNIEYDFSGDFQTLCWWWRSVRFQIRLDELFRRNTQLEMYNLGGQFTSSPSPTQCMKITEKVAFKIASEASYVYKWTKVH